MAGSCFRFPIVILRVAVTLRSREIMKFNYYVAAIHKSENNVGLHKSENNLVKLKK